MRPKEKPIAWVGMFMLLKGSPRPKLAHAYVDAWSSKASAKWLEDNYGYGHANTHRAARVERPAEGAAADEPEGGDRAERAPRPRHPAAGGLREGVGAGEGLLTRRRRDLTTPGLLGPSAGMARRLLRRADRDRRALQLQRLLAVPGRARLHARRVARRSRTARIYLQLFWKSAQMSLIVSVDRSSLLAYPLAYYLALSGTKRKYVLLLLLIAPFLTSYLLRVLAWKVILGDQGVINSFLFWTHLRSPEHPISQLLYSRFAVMLVLGYIWLPFVALPIFVSLENLDRRLLEAASDLGASRLRAFCAVTLPLSLPGVIAAFFFVFIPTLGEFVTPSLVGGATGYMYGNQIVDLFGTGFPDWETGSVLALFLIAGRRAADGGVLALPPAAAGGRGLRTSRSRGTARACCGVLRAVVAFLYAPILILLIFSFNNSDVPTFPLSGFTSTGTASSSSTATCAARSRRARSSRRDERRRGRPRRAGLDRARAASFPRQGRRLRASAEPARDPVPRLRDRAAAALSHAGGPAVDPDRRDRAHRHHAAVHDPRARAAARADRRVARGGRVRPRREPAADVPARSRSR